MKHEIKAIGEHFNVFGDFVSAAPYGSGHINDTYAAIYNQGGSKVRYIFQRINHNVFKNPIKVMENIARVLEHQHAKFAEKPHATRRAMTLIPTIKDELPYFQDNEGNFWRVYVMIEKARTYDVLENIDQAYQAAKAFAVFQRILTDLPGERLHETIPDFHNTPKRFAAFQKALSEDVANRASIAQPEIDFIQEQESIVSTLIDLQAAGKIPERITHNDTKLNNVMIDDVTNEGVCVIDLDTVMPGLALYDFGDMVRSGTNPMPEDSQDLSQVKMRMDMFEALAGGYLSSAAHFLNETEIEYLPFSGQLITFEVAIRFITDFLEGDVYFKTHRENHNLDRGQVQLTMFQSIREHEPQMKNFVAKTINNLCGRNFH